MALRWLKEKMYGEIAELLSFKLAGGIWVFDFFTGYAKILSC